MPMIGAASENSWLVIDFGAACKAAKLPRHLQVASKRRRAASLAASSAGHAGESPVAPSARSTRSAASVTVAAASHARPARAMRAPRARAAAPRGYGRRSRRRRSRQLPGRSSRRSGARPRRPEVVQELGRLAEGGGAGAAIQVGWSATRSGTARVLSRRGAWHCVLQREKLRIAR